MEAAQLTGTYTVDNCGKKEFYGTYYSSEVLNEGKGGKPPKSAKGRLKGELVSSLQARELAQQQFSSTFRTLDTYYHPFCALFYNERERRLGWFRSNGMMADILIGTQTAKEIEDFGEMHGNIKFKYSEVSRL
ncbi:hypothetical protein BRE01_44010 [Brevibacillus reuszeri]|uniref:Uncharacterized protein n=1 Tax=Brevibacillus reuszeri TaxID=54915 RepID=A0A0K9YKU8_9BACL|nr:hypothetical protein [Brevibacillus reuszeri]KNB69292.1 hypothetical protein ADS79_25635 [Brevibacillus reuszeri]MED1860414.1 hypothetical protein [Brevibacillus reuszeri]GED70699.1 hypothetical protein BRE01_44010 [Brevibacillus reuszeri]